MTTAESKTYRAAILGCGPRSYGHADAYKYVPRGEVVAACDMDERRLNEYADRFNIGGRYANVETMLRDETPDVLHIITPPRLRVGLLQTASAHGVPAVVIEKPIALQGEDYRALRELDASTNTKIVVNHQLHYQPGFVEIEHHVRSGAIGDIRFLDASARLPPPEQGTHVLELAHTLLGDARPVQVFGQVSGAEMLSTVHPGPTNTVASIDFDNGVTCQFLCGEHARTVSNNSEAWPHKRVAAYGSKGIAEWAVPWTKRTKADGSFDHIPHNYGQHDQLGQGALTNAVLDWLADESKPHPTRLSVALDQVNIILGIYMSALSRRPVALPVEPEDGLLDAMKAALGGGK